MEKSRQTLLRVMTVLTLLAIAGLLWLLGDLPFPTASAGTFTVDTTIDENDGECEEDCSLRDAIILANATSEADTITLDAATYTLTIPGFYDNVATQGDLDITNPLTITGVSPDQTFIDANHLDRVFDIRPGAGRLALINLTIMYGDAYLGGGIYNADADLVLIDVEVASNSASHGGGVYAKGGTVTMTGSSIRGNEADRGAGVFFEQNSSFHGGRISENLAEKGGGGLYVGPGTILLSGTEIADNWSLEYGGGVFVASGSATLTNGQLLNNHANEDAGGLYLEDVGGSVLMAGGCIVNNWHTAVVNGGGGTLVATANWWGDPSGPSGEGPGSGDSIGSSVAFEPFSAVADGCPSRQPNTVLVDLTVDEYDGECRDDCSLRDAIAVANKQSGYVGLGPMTYTLSISGQNEDNGAYGDLDITGPMTITGEGPDLTVIDADGLDRVIDIRPGAGRVVLSHLTLKNGDAIGNHYGYGGGIYSADADLFLIDAIVASNSAERGGGIYISQGSVTMTGGRISENEADEISSISAGEGGGLYVWTGSATLGDVRVIGNVAGRKGAGVYVWTGSATLKDVRVLGNNAGWDGGGLYVDYVASSRSATLGDGGVIGNNAGANGGGLFLDNHTPTSGVLLMDGGCVVNNSHTGADKSVGTLQATHVWWGSSSGPSGMGPGVGDSVGTGVTFIPFSTSANGCPPRANAILYLPTIVRD